ncbi:MAG: MEKHLA domain-containing protein [Pseudomonadota bacterium]
MPSSKPSDAKLRLIVESYQRLTGKPLIPVVPFATDELRTALWEAPRAIVAHGTEDDPIFFYGNRLALQLFEMEFDEFTRLPSRLSAEPMAQQVRNELLEKVSRHGYVEGYSGMRIAKSGRSFRIADTTVWNLIEENGVQHGQAAVFVAQQD